MRRVDSRLVVSATVRPSSDGNALGARRREREDLGGYELVVREDLRPRDQASPRVR